MMQNELAIAISTGDEGRARRALERGAEVNKKDDYGLSPLHRAATAQNSAIVRLLLDHGADPNAGTRTQRTPIHLSAEADDPDVIQMLLTGGADVNAEDAYGWTPLHDAASARSMQAAIALVDAGGNVSKLSKDGLNPHEVAKKWGHSALSHYLKRVFNEKIRHRPLPSLPPEGASAGEHTDGGSSEEMALLTTAAEDLLTAIDTDNVVAVGRLIERNSVDIDDGGHGTPLFRAVERGNLFTVCMLVDAGAKVNFDDIYGSKPLHIAAKKGHTEVIKVLLEAGADWSDRGPYLTPIHEAAMAGHVEAVKALVEGGASHTGEPCDCSPMHCAAECDHVKVLEELVRLGADVNALTRNDNYPQGRTPLSWAAKTGALGAMEFLLENKANVDGNPGACRKTPLHIAAKYGQTQATLILLEKGADVTLKDEENKTAMDYLSAEGQKEMAKHLKLHRDASVAAARKGPPPPVPTKPKFHPVPPVPTQSLWDSLPKEEAPTPPPRPPKKTNFVDESPEYFTVPPSPDASVGVSLSPAVEEEYIRPSGAPEIYIGAYDVGTGSNTTAVGESRQVSLQAVIFGSVVAPSGESPQARIRLFLFDASTLKSQIAVLVESEQSCGRQKVEEEVFPKLNILMDHPISLYVSPPSERWTVAPNRKRRSCRNFCDVDNIEHLPVAAEITFQYSGPVNETPMVFNADIRVGVPTKSPLMPSKLVREDEFLHVMMELPQNETPSYITVKQKRTNLPPSDYEDNLVDSFKRLGEPKRQTPDGYENWALKEQEPPAPAPPKAYDPRERIVANLPSYNQERRKKLLSHIRQELEQKPMTVAQKLRMKEAFDADIHALVAYLMEELFGKRLKTRVPSAKELVRKD